MAQYSMRYSGVRRFSPNLQSLVDHDKRPGLFILTGSQQFGLLSNISQSLAGRVGIVHLLPFSLHEIQSAKLSPAAIEVLLFKGLFLGLVNPPNLKTPRVIFLFLKYPL
ncbi:MAG: AAA family ATPase [Nitrospiria bacterium]